MGVEEMSIANVTASTISIPEKDGESSRTDFVSRLCAVTVYVENLGFGQYSVYVYAFGSCSGKVYCEKKESVQEVFDKFVLSLLSFKH
jgi:hypothetical protein